MGKKFLFLILLTASCICANAQFLMDMIDTTTEKGKGMLAIYKKFDRLRIGAYIQPQFQVASEKGTKTFAGTDFSSQVNNRFMLRRSRVRLDYAHFEDANKPGVQIVFQFDANERSFTLRDVWGRVFENNLKLFSFTTGMFARPFGFETNLSSSDRESPERGRMNQTLMKSERDLGAMVTFDVRRKHSKVKNLKIDAGVFNGQGINAAAEFDNTKDFIGRVSLKPYHFSKNVTFSAGGSVLLGGLQNNTKYVSSTAIESGIKKVVVDSAVSNIGTRSARQYFGADMQLKYKNRKGLVTELRAEVIAGKQTGTATSSETPTALLAGYDGFHVRNFNGAYFYYLQNIFSTQHQLIVKFDWYDPNRNVANNEIGTVGSNFTAANIKYTTLGFGYLNYLTDNVKIVLYYDRVWNEKTLLPGFTEDVSDNVFTCRLQFRF